MPEFEIEMLDNRRTVPVSHLSKGQFFKFGGSLCRVMGASNGVSVPCLDVSAGFVPRNVCNGYRVVMCKVKMSVKEIA